MYPFSRETLLELQKAGWAPERQIDTTNYERLLRAEGYEVPVVVIEFLRSFGGLKMTHANPFIPKIRELFHFDVELAISRTFYDNVQGNVVDVSLPLCLIGEIYSGELWLTMDETGKVYASDLSDRFVGNSGCDAIEAMCTSRPLPGVFDVPARIPRHQPPWTQRKYERKSDSKKRKR